MYTMEQVKKEKDLGVAIDDELKFSIHIAEKVIKKHTKLYRVH